MKTAAIEGLKLVECESVFGHSLPVSLHLIAAAIIFALLSPVLYAPCIKPIQSLSVASPAKNKFPIFFPRSEIVASDVPTAPSEKDPRMYGFKDH